MHHPMKMLFWLILLTNVTIGLGFIFNPMNELPEIDIRWEIP